MAFNTTGARGMRKSRSTFEEFDALPREVRDAINYAVIKYSTANMARLIAKQGAAKLVQGIADKDAEHVAQIWEEREATEFLKELGL